MKRGSREDKPRKIGALEDLGKDRGGGCVVLNAELGKWWWCPFLETV